MKKRDLKNLHYLLSLDEMTLLAWWMSAPMQDREYATELLANYSQELDNRRILCYDGPEDADFAQANEVINSIKSKL
jgi:predicted protein tyrosine phosphatase